MSRKLNKEIEKIDQLCTEIAMLELDNWDVIQRFRAMEMQIERRYRDLQKYCDKSVIHKKVEEIKNQYGTPRKPRRGGLVVKRRLNGLDKIMLTKAMVSDFMKQKKDKVDLNDINEWLAMPSDNTGDDIRDKLLIRGVKIPQVNWFHIRTTKRGKEEVTILYDVKSYETKKAPYKSFFNVRAWAKFLSNDKKVQRLRNELAHKLSEG